MCDARCGESGQGQERRLRPVHEGAAYAELDRGFVRRVYEGAIRQ